MNPFAPFGWFTEFLRLGFFGFVVLFCVWAAGTILSGYFLGLGIWLAMPRDVKLYFRRPSDA